MWFGIIIFGVANGFILLPAMLSICGPLNSVHHLAVVMDEEEHEIDEEDHKSRQVSFEMGMMN